MQSSQVQSAIIVLAILTSMLVGLFSSGGAPILLGWLARLGDAPVSVAAPDGEHSTSPVVVSSSPQASLTPTPTLQPSATPRPTRTPTQTPPLATLVPPTLEPSPVALESEAVPPTSEATALPSVILTNVSAGRLNVRAAPGVVATVLTSLPSGAEATVVGRDPTSGWLQIQVPGRTELGWVTGGEAFVRVTGELDGVPVVESESSS